MDTSHRFLFFECKKLNINSTNLERGKLDCIKKLITLQETSSGCSICVHNFKDVVAGKLKPVMALAVQRRAPMVLEPQLGLLVVGQYVTDIAMPGVKNVKGVKRTLTSKMLTTTSHEAGLTAFKFDDKPLKIECVLVHKQKLVKMAVQLLQLG